MAQPSKAGPVILTVFALPFLAGGLFFLFAQFMIPQKSGPTGLIAGTAMALFFAFVGGGLIVAAIKGYGLLKKQAVLQNANPSSPWLWRNDWAARRAESASQKSYIGAWILAALGNLFLFPFLFVMVPQLLRQNDPRALIVLAFCSLGVVLIVRAIRATIRHDRFGNSYFEFDSLPFSLGERLGGRIHLRFETQAAHGIDLRLTCVRRVMTGTGNSRNTSNVTLWQADKNVPSGAVGPGPLGRAIPVDFELPAEGPVTDHSDSDDQILWLLHAQADVPGVDYSDDFEVPVFRTATAPELSRESPDQVAVSAPTFGFTTARSIDGDSGEVPRPEKIKVVVSMIEGGTEFYFPAFRTPLRALILLLVSVMFTGAAYALLRSKVPFFFTAIFSLSDLFVIFGFFHVAFGSRRILVGNGEIRSRGAFLGMGATRRIPFSNIASIGAVAGLQQGDNSDSAVYFIRLLTKDGKKLTLADEISSLQEARWIVSQLETLAGLKVDTHVEFALPLGVQGRLPQSGSGRVVFQRRQSTASVLLSFAVFVAVAAALFAWQGRRMFANSARARAATASRATPVAPRVFSGPMTDSDTERILALPAQAQAEELLERAIGHDARALEFFDRNVEGWTGRITQSARMKQLLQRSQYSKDLRVRLANVDISLALEGWQKNQGSSDQLIARARADAQHRAWAVYYLGMLAGRGVDYDRIHRIILDYARNDKDATVRQWAVEGLRFLGKDEVLDELYTSFTEDPAMNVRDRAGCNLSDCGIFTRKQRMRTVPQLIDLSAKQDTSAQMRNWCFLALQEITDANVPGNALAWNRWYADHGAEKMAEFERLEWYQVRGDE